MLFLCIGYSRRRHIAVGDSKDVLFDDFLHSSNFATLIPQKKRQQKNVHVICAYSVHHILSLLVCVCKTWTFALLISEGRQCEGLMSGISDNKEIPRLFCVNPSLGSSTGKPSKSKMKLRVLLAVVATVGAIGMASAQKTTTELSHNEARTTDAIASVHAMPLVCDVKVKTYYDVDDAGKIKSPKTKASDLSWCIENDFHKIDKETSRLTDYWYLTADDVKAFIDAKGYLDDTQLRNYALFRSQQYHKCDVILSPIFTYRTATKDEQSSLGNSIAYTLTVMGFAGEFVNFRKANLSDYDVLNKNHNLIHAQGSQASNYDKGTN